MTECTNGCSLPTPDNRVAKFHPNFSIKLTFWLGRRHVFEEPPLEVSRILDATVEVNEKLITIWRGENWMKEEKKKEKPSPVIIWVIVI